MNIIKKKRKYLKINLVYRGFSSVQKKLVKLKLGNFFCESRNKTKILSCVHKFQRYENVIIKTIFLYKPEKPPQKWNGDKLE